MSWRIWLMRYSLLSTLATCLCMSLASVGHTQQNNIPDSMGTEPSLYRTPIHYRIAEIDPRFNLTPQQLLQLAQQAANIWEQASGQTYFVYDPEAELTIHLVYDERQQQSDNRLQGLDQLKQQKQRLENQNQQIQKFKQDIQETTALIASQQTQLMLQFQQYNNQMQQINQTRSMNKALAEQLTQQQKSLQLKSAVLKQEIQQHNQKTQQLNQQIQLLNQNNKSMVASAQQFNQSFKPRLFHKGNFKANQIYIYEFSSPNDLRLTLAHEFGHALGLQHNDDPKALMYPTIKSQDLDHFHLTEADQALLQAKQ